MTPRQLALLLLLLLAVVGARTSTINIAMVGDGDSAYWVNNMLQNATGIDLPIAVERTTVVQRYCFPYSCHTVCLYDNPKMDVCKCLQDPDMRGCMHILTNLEEISDGVPGGTVFGRQFKNFEKQSAHAPDVIVLLANDVGTEDDTTTSTSCAVSLRAKLPNSDIQILSAEAAGSPEQLLFDATPKCLRTDADFDRLERELAATAESFAQRKATAEAKQKSSRNRYHANIYWCITFACLCLLACAGVNSVVRFSASEWELSEDTPFAGGGIRLAVAAARDVKVVTDTLGFTVKTTTNTSVLDEQTEELDATQHVEDCADCYINPVTFTDVVSEATAIQGGLASKIATLPRSKTKPSGEPVPDGWMEPDLTTIYTRKAEINEKQPNHQQSKKKPRKRKQDWIDVYILDPLNERAQRVYVYLATMVLDVCEVAADTLLTWITAVQKVAWRVIVNMDYYCLKTPYRWYRLLRGLEVTPLVQPAPPPPPPPPLDDDSESMSTEGGVPAPPPVPIPQIHIAPPPSLSRDFSHRGDWVLCCTPSTHCSHEHNPSVRGHLPHWSCCGISNKESQCPIERKDVSSRGWSKTRRALLLAIRTAGAAKAVGANARRDLKWRFRIYTRRILFRAKQLVLLIRKALAKLIRGLIRLCIMLAGMSWVWLKFCGKQTKAFLMDLGFTFTAWDRFKQRCKALPSEVKDIIVNTLLNPPNPFESYDLPVQKSKRQEENWTCSNSDADTEVTGSFTPWEDEVSGHGRLLGRMHSQMVEHGGTAALLREVEKTIQTKTYDDISEVTGATEAVEEPHLCSLQLPTTWKRKRNIQPPVAPAPVVTKVISTQTPRRLVRVKEVDEKKTFTLPDQYRPPFERTPAKKQTKKSGPVSKWVKHQLWPFGKDSDQESDATDQHQLLNPDDDLPPCSPYTSFNDGCSATVNHDDLLGASMYLPEHARQQMRRRKQRERFDTLVGGDVPLLPKNRVESIIKYHTGGEDDTESVADMAPDYLSP